MTQGTIMPKAQTMPSHVAPLLPSTVPAPEPARRINFLKALLLFWLLPRRYGPHLAVGSFKRAFAAHAISVIVAGACLTPIIVMEAMPGPFSLHAVRVQMADLVIHAAAMSANAAFPWAVPLMVLCVVPLVELCLILVATALMPWCPGGDSAWSVWKRSVKNVYWSTTLVVPVAVVALLITLAPTAEWLRRSESMPEEVIILLLLIPAFGVPAILLARVLLVGASRYVGEPAGPAFAAREPRCDECGYLIIGLPLETNCPECGRSVRDSLPGGRRRPTIWQENEFRPRGLLDAVRLQWQVLRGPDLFRTIPVHRGLSAARHFWWLTFGLIAFVMLAFLRLLATIATADDVAMALAPIAGLTIAIPLLAQAAMMAPACLCAQWWYNIRDYRVSAIVCYYASPLMWPVVLVLAIASLVSNQPIAPWLEGFRFTILRLGCDGLELTAIALGLALILAIVFWWSRLCTALRTVRHANV